MTVAVLALLLGLAGCGPLYYAPEAVVILSNPSPGTPGVWTGILGPTRTPTPGGPTPGPGTPGPCATSFVYVVQECDTLSSIAHRFGSTVPAIVQANGLPDADRIYVGQRLNVPTGCVTPRPWPVYTVTPGPSPTVGLPTATRSPTPSPLCTRSCLPYALPGQACYSVRPGDTLTSVGLLCRVTVDDLKRFNELGSDFISAGQVLIVK